MKNLFSTNAYYLLGLPVSTGHSEIRKKARLVLARLSIGEEDLESDFSTIKPDRTEDSLKDALQRLSNPIKKIQEVYLWFSDENSQELVKIISSGNLEEAYNYLAKRSEPKGKWNSKRDFALFLTQLLFTKKTEKKYVNESLELWKDLTSDVAWKYFDLYYKNIDELNTDELAFRDLRKWAEGVISDIYSLLSEKWDDPEYTQAYTKIFGKIGVHTQKNILTPCAREINEAADDLTKIKWHDESPSKDNFTEIKKGIRAIQNALNALIEADLYEEDEVVVLRDKASDAIRGVAIDLTNKYNDYERSAQILVIAEEISGTQSTKSRNQGDISTVEENRTAQKFLVPVLELINMGKFLQAVDYVNHQIVLNKSDQRIVKILDGQLIAVMGRYITETRSAAMEKMNKSDFSGATRTFLDLRHYILEHLDRFDLIREKVEAMVTDIDDRTRVVNKAVFDALNQERDDAVKKLFEDAGETNTTGVLMCLLDCAYYVPLGQFLQMNYDKNRSLNVLFNIGWWTLLIYGIGLLFLIPAYIWQNKDVVYVRE